MSGGMMMSALVFERSASPNAMLVSVTLCSSAAVIVRKKKRVKKLPS